MKNRTKLIIGIAVLAIAAAVPIAGAAIGDDDEAPITGEALEQASQAALDHVGEGSVTDTEVGDEDSYYEVEITREDGTEVDVQLDEDFQVVATEDESDDDESSDAASDGDDSESSDSASEDGAPNSG